MPNPDNPFERIVAVSREQHGPDYRTALLNLIDALRDYIRADEHVAKDLLQEDAITPEQLKRGMAALQPYRLMLKQLEAHGINPSLHGIIKEKG